ncbi:hypothetical protein BY996DRAFT_6412732 [Phakopsora pachyrhizi]|nr:hypothetical protein BY996DRAFT_6412732 [Phakopsora pachyrhizi]
MKTVYLIANIAQKLEHFIEEKSDCQNIDNMDSQSNTSHIVFCTNNFVWTKPPKILKNILVQDSNLEQQIPMLIELAKMLLEWAAPKVTSYSNKEIEDQFWDKKTQYNQVEQGILIISDSLQNNGFSSDEQ